MWLLIDKVNERIDARRHTRSLIDDLGFAFPDLDTAAVEMKKKGVTFQTEPRPFTNAAGQNMKISFVVVPTMCASRSSSRRRKNDRRHTCRSSMI